MSTFWSIWVIVIVVINIVGSAWLLYVTRNKKGKDAYKTTTETTGHSYDGIEEYDNPLPRWWLWMFYLTLIYSVGYLIFYPGLGNFEGTLGWTQENQLEEEFAAADAKYGPIFKQFSETPIEELVNNPKAIKMGKRIFINTCFGCHGSDARGGPGYPDLTDNDWLYGASPDQIKQSIATGRAGVMPGFAESMSDNQLDSVVSYVATLSGRSAPDSEVIEGKELYATNCAVCHGAEGKGSFIFGAPNLTDKVWLYGGSKGMIKQTIKNGRQGMMPGHQAILGDDKVHLVAAYVYSLAKQK